MSWSRRKFLLAGLGVLASGCTQTRRATTARRPAAAVWPNTPTGPQPQSGMVMLPPRPPTQAAPAVVTAGVGEVCGAAGVAADECDSSIDVGGCGSDLPSAQSFGSSPPDHGTPRRVEACLVQRHGQHGQAA